MRPSKIDALLSPFSLVLFRYTGTRRWSWYSLHIFLRKDPMAVRARASIKGAKSARNQGQTKITYPLEESTPKLNRCYWMLRSVSCSSRRSESKMLTCNSGNVGIVMSQLLIVRLRRSSRQPKRPVAPAASVPQPSGAERSNLPASFGPIRVRQDAEAAVRYWPEACTKSSRTTTDSQVTILDGTCSNC
jgi:hypothetical protein